MSTFIIKPHYNLTLRTIHFGTLELEINKTKQIDTSKENVEYIKQLLDHHNIKYSVNDEQKPSQDNRQEEKEQENIQQEQKSLRQKKKSTA